MICHQGLQRATACLCPDLGHTGEWAGAVKATESPNSQNSQAGCSLYTQVFFKGKALSFLFSDAGVCPPGHLSTWGDILGCHKVEG